MSLLLVHTFTFYLVRITVRYTSHPTLGFINEPPCTQSKWVIRWDLSIDHIGIWLSNCHKGTANGLFLMGSCLLPFKTRITGLSQSDSASWRAVCGSQVTVKPILQHISGGLSEWLTIYPVLNSQIWVWSVEKISTGFATGSCRSDRDTISTTLSCLPRRLEQ